MVKVQPVMPGLRRHYLLERGAFEELMVDGRTLTGEREEEREEEVVGVVCVDTIGDVAGEGAAGVGADLGAESAEGGGGKNTAGGWRRRGRLGWCAW